MAYKDSMAAAAQKYKPIQSTVPVTMLGPIQIEAFLGGGVWLVRIDVVKTKVGVRLTPPTGKERAEGWARLQGVCELTTEYEERDRPACDKVISRLGSISVEPSGVPSNNPDDNVKEEYDDD